ncbi:SPOR domain-containing protein [Bacillus massilinigeriensis]|uniref:SPOR domain-containing protein n=1 Tax=Bacillus mediterraneensis TaxID=1805474 RepID=UPI0008F8293E|nr:SPOR domain-containing protein [Bacillus mediterraneensis]
MDKRGKTITIRISGEERPLKRTQQPEKIENKNANNKQRYKVEHWRETAAARENDEESFDWILPAPLHNEKKVRDGKIEQEALLKTDVFRMPPLKKSNGQSAIVRKVLGAVALAIIVGVILGFAILSVVTADKNGPIAKETTTTEETKDATKSGRVTLAPLDLFIVQGGVYSSIEAADNSLKEINAKGVQGEIIDSGGKLTIVLAASPTLEEAKERASDLKENGIDAFAKSFSFGGGECTYSSEEEKLVLNLIPAAMKNLLGSKGQNAGEAAGSMKKVASDQLSDKNIKNMHALILKSDGEDALLKLMGEYSKLCK